MPLLRKKKQRKNDENYEREEFVIPTPSIDQVLQNLASNALEIASGEEGSKSDDEEQDVNGRVESVTHRIEPDLRRSKRKQNLTIQTVRAKIVTANCSDAPSISRNIAKLATGRLLHTSTRICNGRTIAENVVTESSSSKLISSSTQATSVNSMLDELVSRSVKNKETVTTSNGQQKINATVNLNRPIISSHSVQPSKTKYASPPPIEFSTAGTSTSAMSSQRQQIYRELNNFRDNYNQWQQQQNNCVDPRIESTVDQVISSFCSSVGWELTPSKIVQPSNSLYQQVRPHHFIVRSMPNNMLRGGNDNILPKNNIIVNQQESQQPITIDEEENNEEVQIVDDDEGECAPFCKNCASEIPLIIKRLDQLDNMVSRMVTMVKKELMSSNANTNNS